MNIHIELVKKWLADPASVTQQELDDNCDPALDAAYDDYTCADYDDVAYVVYAATHAAADYADYYAAKHWVKRYEELTEQGE